MSQHTEPYIAHHPRPASPNHAKLRTDHAAVSWWCRSGVFTSSTWTPWSCAQLCAGRAKWKHVGRLMERPCMQLRGVWMAWAARVRMHLVRMRRAHLLSQRPPQSNHLESPASQHQDHASMHALLKIPGMSCLRPAQLMYLHLPTLRRHQPSLPRRRQSYQQPAASTQGRSYTRCAQHGHLPAQHHLVRFRFTQPSHLAVNEPTAAFAPVDIGHRVKRTL